MKTDISEVKPCTYSKSFLSKEPAPLLLNLVFFQSFFRHRLKI